MLVSEGDCGDHAGYRGWDIIVHGIGISVSSYRRFIEVWSWYYLYLLYLLTILYPLVTLFFTLFFLHGYLSFSMHGGIFTYLPSRGLHCFLLFHLLISDILAPRTRRTRCVNRV